MLTGTAGAEVVDHSLEFREWRTALGPDVSAVGFLLTWRQHLYRRFVGVDYSLGQNCFAQRIDQRLELHAGLSHPLRQCRARDGEACTAEDFFLSIKRQVISELGHHHVRQQAGCGDALVDHLRRHWGLDQCFAMPADPFPAGEKRVIFREAAFAEDCYQTEGISYASSSSKTSAP